MVVSINSSKLFFKVHNETVLNVTETAAINTSANTMESMKHQGECLKSSWNKYEFQEKNIRGIDILLN